MVKVTQISDEEQAFKDDVKPQENDNDFTDTESEVSDDELDDDMDFESETIVDRIIALKDIIPPQYRSQIIGSASSVYNTLSTGLGFGGKALWVIATSSLLLGVPLSLSIVSEQQLMEMEKEMKVTQSTNEVLAPGAESGFQAPPAPK